MRAHAYLLANEVTTLRLLLAEGIIRRVKPLDKGLGLLRRRGYIQRITRYPDLYILTDAGRAEAAALGNTPPSAGPAQPDPASEDGRRLPGGAR